jgi:PhzF family phenazine biosynthesis protein
MTDLRIVQVDAFAERPFTGNPAAVVPLTAWLPDELMQAIAMENNLAETAFTVPVQDSEEYELRWFTPTVEVALCGHATLASAHVLMQGDEIRFRTRKAGVLQVNREGGAYALSLPAWKPQPKKLPRVVAALGCQALETLWHKHQYAVVLLESEAEVVSLDPDFRALGREGDVLTIVTAPGNWTDVVSRVFAPGAGIDEDPVTGAAHAVLTPFWAERLDRPDFTAYQASKRGGYLACKLAGDRAILGGKCVTVLEGVLRL